MVRVPFKSIIIWRLFWIQYSSTELSIYFGLNWHMPYHTIFISNSKSCQIQTDGNFFLAWLCPEKIFYIYFISMVYNNKVKTIPKMSIAHVKFMTSASIRKRNWMRRFCVNRDTGMLSAWLLIRCHKCCILPMELTYQMKSRQQVLLQHGLIRLVVSFILDGASSSGCVISVG